MPTYDPYAEIVELYDLEHNDYFDDIELLVALAELGEGPILELGCGTGRVMQPLAEAGHTVIGIDASEPMLAMARARLTALPATVVSGDMADMQAVPGGPFGMIIASLNSLMHLTTPLSQLAAITSTYESLGDGGRLVIDTLNPSLSQLNHLMNTTHLEGSWTRDDGTTIDKWGYRRAGEDPQIIDTLLWYDSVQSDGAVHRVRTRFDLRYVHQSELALMLRIAGFDRIDWYGSYELDPWYADADRIIAVAHKD